MLKIKDNVDLKELEKFGFVYEEYDVTEEDDEEPVIFKYYRNGNTYKDYWITVDIDTRILDDECANKMYAEIVPADLIYDLIQAGLVEKVEDNT